MRGKRVLLGISGGVAAYKAPLILRLMSKKGAEPQGLDALQKVCTGVGIPVFAIGGITAANAGQCIDHGASGVALVSAIMAAEDVVAAVSEFNTALGHL